MRPGIVTANPLAKLALASGLAPVPLMQVFWGMGLARAVVAGLRLGLFEALAEGGRSADQLAQAIGCAPLSTAALLAALNGFGFVRRRHGVFTLSAQSRRWLLASAKGSIRDAILFVDELFRSAEPIEQAIRSGQVVNFHHRGVDVSVWRSYLRSLGNFALTIGKSIASKVPVDRPPQRLLDVGGGHGMYSVAMCQRFAGLTCDVLDLPDAIAHGQAMVAEQGMAERVHFRAGDLRSAEWGRDYDLLLLFNVLHNLTAEECRKAALQARAALRPGGTLVVVDSEHAGGDGNLSATAGFNELFFFLVSAAQAWPEPLIQEWLTAAGLVDLRRRRSLILPGLLILSARAA